MSKARDRLTAVQIKNLSKPGFYHDGGGLYLQISRFGSKSWILRYTLNQKKRDMGLGPLTDWTLAEARERAKKYRQLVDDGIDPINQRDQEKARMHTERLEADRKRRSFEECAKEYHAANKDDWKNAKHADQWINTLTTYAFPNFGKQPIAELTREQIREVLEPIWKTKAETASRVLQRIRTVVNYAAARDYCVGLDSEQWDQLKKALPKNTKARVVEHHASCPHDQVGALLEQVRQSRSSDSVRWAFEFIVLTAARSGEVRSAVWEEIDAKTKTWTIPKGRMKAGREHSVPLSQSACDVLQKARGRWPDGTEPTGLIFPGEKSKPISDMTLTQLMRRMKQPYTVHGFRASFRTWGADIAHYEHDMLEIALSHIVGDATVRAYHRSDMVEKRRKLMGEWAVYLQGKRDLADHQ